MIPIRRLVPPASSGTERGQILVLFVIALVAMLWLIRLLIDGANAITTRRAMQDSSDAAALAGANVLIGQGCAANIDAVRAAALASLAANNWGPERATATVSCHPDWEDMGVTVVLTTTGSGLFAAAMPVTVDSTAVNGQRAGGAASVITLHEERCNSFYLNGNVNLSFDGSVHVNSNAAPSAGSCNPSEAAALGSGSASVVTLSNGARMRVRGTWSNINVTPAPSKGSLLTDPYADIDEPVDRPDLFPLKDNPPTKSVKETGCADPPCKNEAIILDPGHYTKAKDIPKVTSGNYLVFMPGVYVFENIPIDNNGGVLCTLPEENPFATTGKGWTYADVAQACATTSSWSDLCQTLEDQREGAARCGALLSFHGFTNCDKSNPAEIIEVGGSARTLLRQYLSGAEEGEDLAQYDGFLLWFSRDHAQNPGCNAVLRGGAGSQFSGVIYGATTNISMAGGGSGEAGSLTLQMVVSTVEFKGGSVFNFHYDSDELSVVPIYGLVE